MAHANDNKDFQEAVAGLVKTLEGLLPDLEQELDERKHGGNGEEFAPLELAVGEIKDAIAKIKGAAA